MSVWVTVACKARLAVMLPLLVKLLADRVTSPEALRLLSALTPASITAELRSWPPADRVSASRAATFCRVVRSPPVVIASEEPAYTGPLTSAVLARTFTAPLAATCMTLR
ncbi:hypothetical protein [Pseudomonas viridiflava]|uniref:hypothetical protein n=1 Tax=Pseudomonas viridiflava TaxID=33069 RepID=UPI003BF5047F